MNWIDYKKKKLKYITMLTFCVLYFVFVLSTILFFWFFILNSSFASLSNKIVQHITHNNSLNEKFSCIEVYVRRVQATRMYESKDRIITKWKWEWLGKNTKKILWNEWKSLFWKSNNFLAIFSFYWLSDW